MSVEIPNMQGYLGRNFHTFVPLLSCVRWLPLLHLIVWDIRFYRNKNMVMIVHLFAVCCDLRCRTATLRISLLGHETCSSVWTLEHLKHNTLTKSSWFAAVNVDASRWTFKFCYILKGCQLKGPRAGMVFGSLQQVGDFFTGENLMTWIGIWMLKCGDIYILRLRLYCPMCHLLLIMLCLCS